jgi:hypothetical protein
VFFFEKKNQKTFIPNTSRNIFCGVHPGLRSSTFLYGKKFFGSFFKKRTASLRLADQRLWR